MNGTSLPLNSRASDYQIRTEMFKISNKTEEVKLRNQYHQMVDEFKEKGEQLKQ